MFGGAGNDHFVFDHFGPSNHNQHDVILDFTHGDRIELHSGVQGFNDLQTSGDRYMEDYDSDSDGAYDSVLIHTSDAADTSILLHNVLTASLTENDFLFS